MGETREWHSTDVSGDRITGDSATEVASAILHTTTTTQGQGEVGEAREWEGTDVGSDRTTGDGDQVIQQRRERVTNGGRSPVRTRRLRLIWLLVPQEITSPTAMLTPLRMDPSQHHAPAPTPAAPPTLHQHRHQQWRNTLTHATTIEGSPGQQRAAQKRRPGHRGPRVMSQQTLYRGGGRPRTPPSRGVHLQDNFPDRGF